ELITKGGCEMKKKPVTFLFNLTLWLLVLSTGVFAQKSSVDSLKKLLPTSSDTTRVKILNALAIEIRFDNPKEAINLAEESLKLATKIRYIRGIAESNDVLGRAYYELNE